MKTLWSKVNERVSLEAVLSAAALDLFITTAAMLVAMIPFLISLIQRYGTQLNKSVYLTAYGDYLAAKPDFLMVMVILASFLTIICGYLAAHLAKKSELLHGFLAGAVSCVFVLIQQFGYSVDPDWSQYSDQLSALDTFGPVVTLALYIATPLCGMLGGYLYLKLKKRGIYPTIPRFVKKLGVSALFEGRMGRWAAFASSISVVVLYALGAAILIFLPKFMPFVAGPIAFFIVMAIFIIITIAMLVLSYSIIVRRLHDIGITGWFGFTNYLPYIGTIFGLFMIFWPGAKGANKYGEPQDSFSLKRALTGSSPSRA